MSGSWPSQSLAMGGWEVTYCIFWISSSSTFCFFSFFSLVSIFSFLAAGVSNDESSLSPAVKSEMSWLLSWGDERNAFIYLAHFPGSGKVRRHHSHHNTTNHLFSSLWFQVLAVPPTAGHTISPKEMYSPASSAMIVAPLSVYKGNKVPRIMKTSLPWNHSPNLIL